MSEALCKQARYENLKKSLRSEPAASNETANIKFQLPNGKKLTRNFLKSDSVQVPLESIL